MSGLALNERVTNGEAKLRSLYFQSRHFKRDALESEGVRDSRLGDRFATKREFNFREKNVHGDDYLLN